MKGAISMKVEVNARIENPEERKAFMAWVRTHAHGYSEIGEVVSMSVITDDKAKAQSIINVFEAYPEHTIIFHS
ncbi:MAG: hypothetical protein NC218_03690 [Acetobacter sp.]|nr:hypothetical protein [Acetobacter sp.]